MAVDEVNQSEEFDFTFTPRLRDPGGIVAAYTPRIARAAPQVEAPCRYRCRSQRLRCYWIAETWCAPYLRCPEPASVTAGAGATAGPSHYRSLGEGTKPDMPSRSVLVDGSRTRHRPSPKDLARLVVHGEEGLYAHLLQGGVLRHAEDRQGREQFE